MKKYIHKINIVLTIIIILMIAVSSISFAAPAALLQKIRYSQQADKVRVVLDLSEMPVYQVTYLPERSRIQIDLTNTGNQGVPARTSLNDTHVAGIRVEEAGAGNQRIFIDLKAAVSYQVLTLSAPKRLVIDINRRFEQKIVSEVEPGITHTYWQRGRTSGPVLANILTVDLTKGYSLRPLLSNGTVQELDTLSSMAAGARAIAAVNGSYFAPTGEILGLLKIDGEIVSAPALVRTAIGVTPEGRILIDQVGYEGTARLPGNKTLAINGVNCARGDNALILYNGYFGAKTQTNNFGTEITVESGRVVAVNKGDSLIPAGAVVLSGHGAAGKALAALKPGDPVVIKQSLDEWDKVEQAMGAGPMLLKNGDIFITTKIEEFGTDVAGGRAPRTAAGLTRDGKLLLVTVDGRQA